MFTLLSRVRDADDSVLFSVFRCFETLFCTLFRAIQKLWAVLCSPCLINSVLFSVLRYSETLFFSCSSLGRNSSSLHTNKGFMQTKSSGESVFLLLYAKQNVNSPKKLNSPKTVVLSQLTFLCQLQPNKTMKSEDTNFVHLPFNFFELVDRAR